MHCICHVQEMTAEEAAHIKSFDKCDFTQIHQYFKEKSEAKKQLSKEEKQVCIYVLCEFISIEYSSTINSH